MWFGCPTIHVGYFVEMTRSYSDKSSALHSS